MRKEERWFDFSHRQLGYPTEPGHYPLRKSFAPDTVYLSQEVIDAWAASGFKGRIAVEQKGYSQQTLRYEVATVP